VCAHAVRVSLKSVAGVDAVEVSLEKGLATIKMKPGNAATLKQLQEAITKNGFTMKESKATIAGQIFVENGKAELKISGSNDVLSLIAENPAGPSDAKALDAKAMNGKFVVVQGTIPEAAKNKLPDAIRYQSIVEEGK
jgi:copper chaperone CopZ